MHTLVKELVQLRGETLRRAKQCHQVANVVVYVPDVGPGVILVVVGSCANASREDVVEGLNKLAFGIFGVEETCLLVEEFAVVETALHKEVMLLLFAQLLGQLRDAPIVVRCRQRNGYRLTLLKASDTLYRLLLAGVQCGEPTILMIEVIEFGLRAAQPRYHSLGHYRVAYALECALNIEIDALAQCVSEDCSSVVTVHTVSISEDRRECRHPARLAIHSHKRVQFLALVVGVEDYLQGVQCVIGIPRPIVSPVGLTLVVVYLLVEATEVTALLRDVNHTLVATVQRCVECCALILRAALYANLAQSLVPRLASGLGNGIDVVLCNLVEHMALCLLRVDVRHAVTGLYGRWACRGSERCITYGVAIRAAKCLGRLLKLQIEVVLYAVIVIPAPKSITLAVQLTASGAQLDVTTTRLLECATEYGRVFGRREIYRNHKVVQQHRVAIRFSLLLVVAVAEVGLDDALVARKWHHHQHRTLTVRRHVEGQTAHTVCRKLIVVGVHTQHRVG